MEKNLYLSKEDKSKVICTYSDIVQVKIFVCFIPCNQNLQITCYFEKDFYVSKINKAKKISRKLKNIRMINTENKNESSQINYRTSK